MGAALERAADTVYFGGGTPSLLSAAQVRQIFGALRDEFDLASEAEITVECAPGQLDAETLEEFQRQGMNRVSLGVQSFVDREAKSVGRLHTGAECEAEIARLQRAGVERTGLDLIAGLPHQTAESWRESVKRTIASGVGHVSIYMLEIDDESRLGRETLSGGRRYGAGELPAEDDVAEWYERGCELLDAAGIMQYEISNFASKGQRSRHNTRYWQRLPYIGFGLDAHSMLPAPGMSVRFQNADDLDVYMARQPGGLFPLLAETGGKREVELVGEDAAFEESLFLGLRQVGGVSLHQLREEFGEARVSSVMFAIGEVCEAGLLARESDVIRLTAKGRLASNEVFSRLLIPDVTNV